MTYVVHQIRNNQLNSKTASRIRAEFRLSRFGIKLHTHVSSVTLHRSKLRRERITGGVMRPFLDGPRCSIKIKEAMIDT